MYGCTDKPVERPGSVAILDRARESLAGLAEMAAPWFRPLVRQSAEVVEELAPFISPVPLAVVVERLDEIKRTLNNEGFYTATARLILLEADLHGRGPEELRTIPVADAAGRVS